MNNTDILTKGFERRPKMKLNKEAFKTLGKVIDKNLPEILTGVAAASAVVAVFMSGKATVKAVKLVEEEKAKRAEEAAKENMKPAEMTKTDVVKTTWKAYVPTTGMLLLSVTACVMSNRMSAKRLAALATAYGISERKLKEYKGKVEEMLGEKKAKQIDNAISQDRVNNTSMDGNLADPRGGAYTGGYLCYDEVLGTYFRSTQEKVRQAANELTRNLLIDNSATVSDLYDILGIEHPRVADMLGWKCYDSGDLPEFDFSTCLYEPTSEPCLTFCYDARPFPDWDMDRAPF